MPLDKLIQDRINSGMTVVDWCQANGYTKHAYYYWLARVQRDSYDDAIADLPVALGRECNNQAFVEISNSPATNHTDVTNISNNPAAILRKGDLTIDIYSDTDSFLIKTIIEAVYHVQA